MCFLSSLPPCFSVDLAHVGVKWILVLFFRSLHPGPTSLPSVLLPSLLAPDKFRMGVSAYGVCTLWGLIFSLRPLLLSWMLGVWVLFLSGGHYYYHYLALTTHHSFLLVSIAFVALGHFFPGGWRWQSR